MTPGITPSHFKLASITLSHTKSHSRVGPRFPNSALPHAEQRGCGVEPVLRPSPPTLLLSVSSPSSSPVRHPELERDIRPSTAVKAREAGQAAVAAGAASAAGFSSRGCHTFSCMR